MSSTCLLPCPPARPPACCLLPAAACVRHTLGTLSSPTGPSADDVLANPKHLPAGVRSHAWSGAPIQDTSCGDHPLTGVPYLRPGPRTGTRSRRIARRLASSCSTTGSILSRRNTTSSECKGCSQRRCKVCATTTWTILEQDCPNHLGLCGLITDLPQEGAAASGRRGARGGAGAGGGAGRTACQYTCSCFALHHVARWPKSAAVLLIEVRRP